MAKLGENTIDVLSLAAASPDAVIAKRAEVGTQVSYVPTAVVEVKCSPPFFLARQGMQVCELWLYLVPSC
jgi:hypothetical protein